VKSLGLEVISLIRVPTYYSIGNVHSDTLNGLREFSSLPHMKFYEPGIRRLDDKSSGMETWDVLNHFCCFHGRIDLGKSEWLISRLWPVASDSVNARQALMPALRWGDSRCMPDKTGVASLEAQWDGNIIEAFVHRMATKGELKGTLNILLESLIGFCC
jgi:hypothetical protein